MTKNREEQGGYSQIWDIYVKETFPRIEKDTPYIKRKLEPRRVLNTKEEKYDWPGDEWGDKQAAARLLDESLTSALDKNPYYLCELGAGAGRYTVLALERFRNSSILSQQRCSGLEECSQ